MTLSASVCTCVAGATTSGFIVARSTVTALAADGNEAAFATAPTASDCDRVFIWRRIPSRVVQLGKKQRCGSRTTAIAGLAVTGGRALWVTSTAGKLQGWSLWTATTTKPTPRPLQSASSGVDGTQPIVVGVAGGGLLPYAVGSTVTTLRADGMPAFTWTAPARVVALAARGGHVAVAQEGSRVTVLDAHGNVVSVDLFMDDITAVGLTAKGLLVLRGAVLELRRVADAHEYATVADAQLDDADGKWAVWSDSTLVHLIRLPEGVQTATYAGSSAALAGSRLYVAGGRKVTVRTIG